MTTGGSRKKYRNLKLNGGGDLTLATLDGELIDPTKDTKVIIAAHSIAFCPLGYILRGI